MFVKMCGMMRREDLAMCGELGIGAAGIVVEYPSPVPWNVDRVAGRRLVAEAPQGLQVVMVTSGTPRDIAELASYVQPHMVQVHGEESLKDVAEIVERLRPLGIGGFPRAAHRSQDKAGCGRDHRSPGRGAGSRGYGREGHRRGLESAPAAGRDGGSRRRRNHRRHRAGRRRAHRGRGRPERGKRRRGDQARTAVGAWTSLRASKLRRARKTCVACRSSSPPCVRRRVDSG